MHPKRRSVPALVFFFCALPLFSGPLVMFSPGDPLLEDLRAVVREGGKSFLSLTPPLASPEAAAALEGIDPALLSEGGRRRYRRIADALTPAPVIQFNKDESGFPAVAAAFQVNAALEGRWRSAAEVPWLKRDTSSPALLSLPLQVFLGDTVELFAEPFAAADPWYYNHPAASWGSNVPWEAPRFDLNVPLRAYAAAGGAWWNFQLGRDRLSFGPGRTGNLAVSDNPDYYDFARLSFFPRIFKYSIVVSQMPLNAAGLLADTAAMGAKDANNIEETVHRYLYLHRLDIRFFDRLSLGLSEGVMAGNAPLELRYLNPLMVFHSFFSWKDYPGWGKESGDMTGSLFSADIAWAVYPGWALYGQIVINEFSTPYEAAHFPDQPPPGMGYLAGAEYRGGAGAWFLSAYMELVYTDPYLYTLSSPFASMIWMRRSSDLGNKDLRYAWIGHGEGRDMFLAGAGFSAGGERLRLSLDLSFKMQGEHGIAWDWDIAGNSQKSPSGTAETLGRALAGASFMVHPSLTLSAWLGGTVLFDAGHVPGNREQGAEAGLRASYHYGRTP